MLVSLRPSVSDQPATHFVRSTVQPSGPVSVLPSAERPQWLSLMRLTMAARSLAHSDSHSASDEGVAPAAVAVPPAVLDVADPAEVAAAAEVEESAASPSSPPQPAATRASPVRAAVITTRLVRCTGFPLSSA